MSVATSLADAVVVLVGAPASGKTTLRVELIASGVAPSAVLSLDDERAALYERDLARFGEARPLQDYSLTAVRRGAAAAERLLAVGSGYVADATHLRRRERVAHVRAARAAGLRAVAVLLPDVPVDELTRRNARRPLLRRVPEEVLGRHAHRRSLLSADLLRDEGFDVVLELPGGE